MGRFNWGAEGPPEDAYSRVTEPERFRPLHESVLEFVARLQADYEVTREEGTGLDTELEKVPLSRATIRVTPLQNSCAPVTIAFTDFPGLAVRLGRWETAWFPSCGCDACDEMADKEFERFTELLSDVVAGRFRESLHLGWRGDGRRMAEFWSGGHRRSKRNQRVPRNAASQALKGRKDLVLDWMPWPPLRDDSAILKLDRP